MSKAREFFIERITTALNQMTDEELADMAQDFTGYPGAMFHLMLKHCEQDHDVHSCAQVLFEAEPGQIAGDWQKKSSPTLV
jgi:hypothetical protein